MLATQQCQRQLVGWSLLICTFALNTAFAQTNQEIKQALIQPGQELALRLPKEDVVTYQGMVSHDAVGLGTGGMFYPAIGGLPGFFAALVTHGLINESSKKSQKTAKQLEADKVLLPYQDVIQTIKYAELIQAAKSKFLNSRVSQFIHADKPPSSEWVVESVPVYSLTQDESALVLQNLISIYAPGKYQKAIYQNVIKAVSKPTTAEKAQDVWLADSGKEFKHTSIELMSITLDIAFREASGDFINLSEQQKTYRYKEGKTDTFERAYRITSECGRALLKNLRGAYMSVPAEDTIDNQSSDTKCAIDQNQKLSTN
jgi:hypothetical protein